MRACVRTPISTWNVNGQNYHHYLKTESKWCDLWYVPPVYSHMNFWFFNAMLQILFSVIWMFHPIDNNVNYKYQTRVVFMLVFFVSLGHKRYNFFLWYLIFNGWIKWYHWSIHTILVIFTLIYLLGGYFFVFSFCVQVSGTDRNWNWITFIHNVT